MRARRSTLSTRAVPRFLASAAGARVRAWIRAIAGAASLLGAAMAGAEPAEHVVAARPIAWQDQGPFAQQFLQLPFDGPEPIPPGALEVGVRTLYSNSIARESNGALSVDVSLESAVPTIFVRYGLPRGFELQLSVPGAIDYEGFLWRPIKVVEGLFGAANPLRAGRPPAIAWFRIHRSGRGGLDWSGSGGSADDPWLGVKRRVRFQDGWRPELSWRAALQAPVAPLPWGSGQLELGTGLLAGWSLGDTSLLLEADVMIPQGGPITAAELRTRPHFTIQLGAVRRFGSWLTAMLQASLHTSAFAGTDLSVVGGTTTYLLAGVGVQPTRRTSISFAIAENVISPARGADISGVLELGWRSR